MKPYNNKVINIFDGVVLQLIIFIVVPPLLDDFDSPLVITITFVLVILPLIIFIVALALFLSKGDLKKNFALCTLKSQTPTNDINKDNNNEAPMKEFHLIIDDSPRKKAKITICDM